MRSAIRNWWLTWNQVAGHWQNLGPYFRPLVLRLFVSWFALAPIAIRLLREFPDLVPVRVGEAT